jgi:hypothetical protein
MSQSISDSSVLPRDFQLHEAPQSLTARSLCSVRLSAMVLMQRVWRLRSAVAQPEVKWCWVLSPDSATRKARCGRPACMGAGLSMGLVEWMQFGRRGRMLLAVERLRRLND